MFPVPLRVSPAEKIRGTDCPEFLIFHPARFFHTIKTDERFIDRTKCIEISRRTSNTSYCNADFPGKVIAGFPEQVKDNSSSFILVLRTQSSINCPAKPNCLLP